MATDIRLDEGPSKNWISVDAPVLNVSGTDFMLDSAAKRGPARAGYRRALVHGDGDQLVVNFNGDYTGGVFIRNARPNIACLHQVGSAKLPKDGALGDLLMTHNRIMHGGELMGTTATLWLCVGRLDLIAPGGAYWVPLSQGEAVEGTL